MIIPFGHERVISRTPYLTYAVIAVCTLVQIYATWFVREPAQHPILKLGYEPGTGLNEHLVTAAFVHGGWFHLAGNMLFLWLAGSALEDRLGRIKFLVLYLVGAATSAYAFAELGGGERTVLVGASGAISALLGAFLVYFSSTRIMLWYCFLVRTGTTSVVAYVVLPLWLVEQLVLGSIASTDGVDRVAYSAHVGGFVAGLVIALLAVLAFGRRDDDYVAA